MTRLALSAAALAELDRSAELCHCGRGGEPHAYSDAYDSFFCILCFRWLEGKCSDESCQFCASRPATAEMGKTSP